MRTLDELTNELSLYLDRLEEAAQKNDDSTSYKDRDLLGDILGQLRDVADIVQDDLWTLPRAVENYAEEQYGSGKEDGYDDGYADCEWESYSSDDVEEARSEGFADGYDEGYEDGRGDCVEEEYP